MQNLNTSPSPDGDKVRVTDSCVQILSQEGYEHLLDEGFSPDNCQELTELGWRWIQAEEAGQIGFGLKGPDGDTQIPSGLLMPLGEHFIQLRCAEPLPLNSQGKPVKYLTVAGQRPVLEPTSGLVSERMSEDWDGPLFLTEGAKDGMAATLRGVPMGVLAGVSHVRKALPAGCGWGLLFDSDGWTNHQVFVQLFQGALHTKGKVQILPTVEGKPKAGLCEYFASGRTASDLSDLLSGAMSANDLLLAWPEQLARHPDEVKRLRCVKALFQLAVAHLNVGERTILKTVSHRHLDRVIGRSNLNALWKAAEDRHNRILRRRQGYQNPSQLANFYTRIEDRYRDRIRYNQRQMQLELDGRPIERLGKVQLDVAMRLQLDVPMDHVRTIVQELGDANGYDPVLDYLGRVEIEYASSRRLETFFDDAAYRYFGTADPLAAVFLKKWAMSAVARTLDPGCKVDTALFLRGGQGYGKSSFFKALCEEEEWFTDSVDSVDKDGILTAHRHWVIEWSELEVVFKKADQSFVKSFMSRTADTVRAPYGESYVRYPRRFVLVGTTNETDFLSDPTGSRRFWVVNVEQPIPTEVVRQERDLFWAAAIYALRDLGEAYYLDRTQDALSQKQNQAYASTHPWEEPIALYLQEHRKQEITINELYEHIEPEVARRDKRGQMAITDILTRLGWTKGERKRLGNGLRVVFWVAPTDEQTLAGVQTPQETPTQGGHTPPEVWPGCGQGCGHPQNPVHDSVSGDLATLATPLEPELSGEPKLFHEEPAPEKKNSVSEPLGTPEVWPLSQDPENPGQDSVSACPHPRPHPGHTPPEGVATPPEPATASNPEPENDREESRDRVATPPAGHTPLATPPERVDLSQPQIEQFVLKSEWVDPLHPRAGNGRNQFFRVIRVQGSRVWLMQVYEGSNARPQSVGDQSVPLTCRMADRLIPRGQSVKKVESGDSQSLLDL